MSKGTVIFAFSLGAAIGSLVTWKMLKTKYEKIAQEEIDSVKEVFSRHRYNGPEQSDEEPVDCEKEAESDDHEKSMKEYDQIVKKYTNEKSDSVNKDSIYDKKPYVIAPEEFGELDNYETESLTYYYSDGVLTDDFDNVISDVEDMIGVESLEHFGEYEDDSVYVRNEKYQCDYEILLDNRNYSDVFKNESNKSGA